MSTLVFATLNEGKLKELRALVGPGVKVVTAAEAAPGLTVDEDQPTFEANAAKKARAVCERTGLPSLADDSGLCVDALGGAPGVYSARYDKDEASRIARLLSALAAVPAEKRTAAFRCALALALPGQETIVEVGECQGRIVATPRGQNGFGYDPVFELPDGRTMAELTTAEKSAVSHRGRAFEKLKAHLLRLRLA